jgi:hypothetical protein
MTLAVIKVTLFITFTHCQSIEDICKINPGVMNLEIIVEGRETKVDMGEHKSEPHLNTSAQTTF